MLTILFIVLMCIAAGIAIKAILVVDKPSAATIAKYNAIAQQQVELDTAMATKYVHAYRKPTTGKTIWMSKYVAGTEVFYNKK